MNQLTSLFTKNPTLFLLAAIFIFGNCDDIKIDNYSADSYGGEKSLYDRSGSDYYPGTEKFDSLTFNPFVFTVDDNLSTFGVDVDAGSYTFGRKKINEGHLPPKESVRIEEYINYFKQDYPQPITTPFSVSVDGAPSPFRGDSLHILRIGLQGRDLTDSERKAWNLTFLVDISGSMTSRLDLVKKSLYILVDQMQAGDKISICTYAGGVGTVLMPTTLSQNDAEGIKGIIADLTAGGTTAMASGLYNAYTVNLSGFINDGVNRVIVCSDGDANVGSTSHEEILTMISTYVEKGITLSTLGFGQGNYNDYLMERLADRGNGNYYYIDSLKEAERLFTEELVSVMEVIAKDVKIQVEFNPVAVIRYRLIGYENRNIADQDFENDTTDAGEIGAGHRVTALYELELTDLGSGNLGTVHLRYKAPNGDADIPLDVNISASAIANTFSEGSKRLRFTIGIAEYAEILRGSPYVNTTLNMVEEIMMGAVSGSDDRDVEFLELIRKAQTIE
ncbi:MAG: von Willebrand factor type A domain-containing protein [Candidatus Marinimicrobia bacterium]|nr:von Willebrand factor type A domain-containing protein [Candidatus Neomarinimicrobiota bacterium]MBL7031225.1 von Willebrand factor type A domain-containing protein [Candidatus Neomarinimicrobiota bacterium]